MFQPMQQASSKSRGPVQQQLVPQNVAGKGTGRMERELAAKQG